MAGKNLDYWYDEQIKRYLLQIIRIFSGFQTREYTKNGVKYNRVPARYGDMSRMVASIMRKNTENIINSAPFISISIQSLQVARDRTHEPFLVDTTQVAEREFDQETQSYGSDQGNLYTTKRYMPVPYNLTIQMDLWSNNTDTKLQVLEQIFILFNPSIQLQSNSNPLDWTSVFEVELTDIAWSNRSVPVGTDDSIDISTLTFSCPIWISPPAKIKKQGIIQRIIANIHSAKSISDLGYDEDYSDFFGDIEDTAEVVVTPGMYSVRIAGASAVLLNEQGIEVPWSDITEMQGDIRTTSLLKLNTSNDTNNYLGEVVGTISVDTTNTSNLIFNLDTDTLPTDTINDVDKIIDPRANYPGDGTLDAASNGQRYLITEDISAVGYPNWGLDANANDILEYNGSAWVISFDASSQAGNTHYMHNTFTSKQFQWTGTQWISSYEGEYKPGYWRLIL
tara:strand:- start:1011 stop:2363 length:1353 start_codon:yes stop_codon:yes gene_type:complete